MTTQFPPRARLPARALLLALPLGALLGGCQLDRGATGSLPDDYRQRHPIALVEAPRTIDVYAARNAPGLDHRQAKDVEAFAAGYARDGRGPITAVVPRGAGERRQVDAIRTALAAGGATGNLRVVPYDGGGDVRAPVRLSYGALQAKVTHACGEQAEDAAQLAGFRNLRNESLGSFGCATQQYLAAQIADPRDLVTPRAETKVDVVKRVQGIEALRAGSNPSTATGVGYGGSYISGFPGN